MQELLKQLAIESSIATQILAKYNSEIESKTQEINTVKATLGQKENEVNEMQKTINNLEKIDHKALKEELEKAKTDFKSLQEKHKIEMKDIIINNAIETALFKNDAINNKAIMPFIEKALINISENGEVIGISEQIKNLKENDETKFLFKTKEKQEHSIPNIPGLNINTGGIPGQSKGTPQVNTWGNNKFTIDKIPKFEEFAKHYGGTN